MTHPLSALALSYVTALTGKPNTFVARNSYLDRNGAATSCSTFVTHLLKQRYDINNILFAALFGSLWPRAADYAHAFAAGLIPPVRTVLEITPGTLGAIGYSQERDGMTGHAFVVVEKPIPTGSRWGAGLEFKMRVVDSCRSSHGEMDTRATTPGGIGAGYMRLIANLSGEIVAYSWSLGNESEIMHNGQGQFLAFANVPNDWSLHE